MLLSTKDFNKYNRTKFAKYSKDLFSNQNQQNIKIQRLSKGPKKKKLSLVIINRKEKYKMEKILNKRKFRGKNRYLV